MKPSPPELIVDRYELTMAGSFLQRGIHDDHVAFELFVRRLPPDRGFLVAAGLEQAVEYLTGLAFAEESLAYLREAGIASERLSRHLAGERFDGALDAVAEGTVVHANEPLLRVEGRRLVCQLVESFLLATMNFQTLIATKAARVVEAADGLPVVDFGLRRAHGGDAGVMAARAAYIGGCGATATVAAGYLWGIPTSGTMAHSYVLSFPSEIEAFCAFLHDCPGNSTLLVDTYDTIEGTRNAIRASERCDVVPAAIRIDSDLAAPLAVEIRDLLDAGGLAATRIVCSGELNEFKIATLVADRAPVDGFGVGTALTTSADAPNLGGVYKLVESGGRPVMKRGDKGTLPGRHQVFRTGAGDVIGLADEELPGRPLLEPVLRDGRRVEPAPSLDDIRAHAAREIAALPGGVRALKDPIRVPPTTSRRLAALKEELDARP